MRILLMHPNFPAQFVHIAAALGHDSKSQVVYVTQREEGSIPGVNKILYKPSREVRPETHPWVRNTEKAVLEAQAVYRELANLKTKGFVPDVIYGHSGWGPTLYMKDLFPQAALVCYFEWFYRSHGSDCDFDPSEPVTPDLEASIRIKNGPILLDLYSCDHGVSPTNYQQSQFPEEYRKKISVLHDGVNTDFHKPNLGAKLVLPELQLDLSHVDELVTYVARGMEPYRGFPQFIEAMAILLKRRPNCHVVIVGAERVAYGRDLPDGKSYKQLMLEKVDIDMSRVHFTGLLSRVDYIKVLQASSVHVYLTRPFVLSWSMLEAMSSGCAVVASGTAPVKEVIEDGVNGLLVDFFSPTQIAATVEEALTNKERVDKIRVRARETILERYDLRKLLPRQIDLLQQVVNAKHHKS